MKDFINIHLLLRRLLLFPATKVDPSSPDSPDTVTPVALPIFEEDDDKTCIVERIAPRFDVGTGNKETEEDTRLLFSFLLLLLIV